MPTLRARETSLIVEVQRTGFGRAAIRPAQALSLFGEHAAGWIVLGLIGAALDWSHAAAWLWSVLAVMVAHLMSVMIKRFVRRPRPGAVAAADGSYDLSARGGYTPGGAGPVLVHAKAPSKLSFPSSHASSTMAAVVVYTAFVPGLWPLAVIVALAMGVSRIVLGMHFPTDVLAGYLIGLIVGVPTVLLLH